MDILIIGLGYVGLTKAVHFAQNNNIYGYDVDKNKSFPDPETGKLWIKEPLLEELYEKAYNEDHIYSYSLDHSVELTDVAFVCVGTPAGDNGEVILDYVYQAMSDLGRAIAKSKKENYLVILKSTVTPGTSEKCIKTLEQTSGLVHGEGLMFTMVPEFLQEGKALAGLAFPDKIVIGHKYKKEFNMTRDLYLNSLSSVAQQEAYIFPCNYVNAEFIKYANNSMLATKISFINEFANFCEAVEGADINVISKAIGMDHRIAPNFLQAGLGFGGSCFGKDVDAIREFADRNGLDSTFLSEVLSINYSQRDWAVSTAKSAMNTHVKHNHRRRVAILGLAFKPNTDDLRDAPAVDIIKQFLLYPKEYQVIVHDPVVKKMDIINLTSWDVTYQDDVANTIRNADCVILCTDWDEYKNISPEEFERELRTPIVIDGRRIYKPQNMLYNNIDYYGVGYGRFDARN